MSGKPSFCDELKRRDVFRMAGLYLIGAWLLIQMASTMRLSAIRETHFVSPRAFVAVAAALNDRDLAFSEIERALQPRDPFLPSIGIDENIAPIKNDPASAKC